MLRPHLWECGVKRVNTTPQSKGTSARHTDAGCVLWSIHRALTHNQRLTLREGPRPPKHTGGDSCLAFLDAHGVGIPACPLHAKANDVRPFLAVGVDFVYRKFLQHFTLRLQLVQLPLILLGGHLLRCAQAYWGWTIIIVKFGEVLPVPGTRYGVGRDRRTRRTIQHVGKIRYTISPLGDLIM